MFSNSTSMSIRLLMLGLIVSMLSACDDDETNLASRWPSLQSIEDYETTAPIETEFSKELRFYSVVTGFNSVTMTFFESGRLETLSVTEGQHVQTGDVLAKLYSPTLAQEMMEAEAAKGRFEAELQLHREDLARGIRLRKKAVISAQELDELQRAFDVASQSVKEAEYVLARITNKVNDLTLKAKEPGIVSEVFKREGDFLEMGEPFLRFESTQRQKVSFELPEQIALTLDRGYAASMYIPALQQLISVNAIERSLPTKGDLALHKLTFEIEEPLPNAVGLRGVLILHTSKTIAHKIDYRAIRYSMRGEPYMLKANEGELTKVPVNMLSIDQQSAYVNAHISSEDRVLVGSDVSVAVNLSKF